MKNRNENDREYAIALLVACIDNLARELAIKTDSDPSFLISKIMLTEALSLQYQGWERVNSILESDYGWLVDQIENLVY